VESAQGTIVIRPKFFVLAFLLHFFTPKGSINGHEVPLLWKVPNPFPVPPGRYEVAVWLPYMFFPRMGYSTVIVDVAPGAAVHVVWNAPWLVFLAGSIRAENIDPRLVHGGGPSAPQQLPHAPQAPQFHQAQQAQAAGGGGGSWQPDPSGRHQYRWWNGTSWAPDVSDGGVNSHDPL
jgi:hypothetical protein